ncbi:dTDP-4-dehydrorhamnose reductase [Hippea maritima]|uniref:dTDP-4-dehydrorhamnose reductase n=1 Tax=Hippea maritima (strain ATCC 700847 / DSM 10411 / MH2) TaxID=760142 RepID=F2LUX8_HIPMA|nr:dTDP-4-dehydrorhamnose reductase [Hippea maritima]AEA34647.1 dTDP-4-dehydrorhamnose reductase [Hippea maritima DSM 10411]
MNVLVTGANGQLGSEIKYLVKNNLTSNIKHLTFFFTDKDKLDITKKEEIEKFVKEKDIDLIINCAAYTAVDKAEEEKELSDLINHQAVKYLANISKENDITLIHISTDYVFDGKNYKPYKEDYKTNPQGIYGLTKLKGEEAFINSGARGIIIRTSWVYSTFGHNFVKTMLRLKDRSELNVVFDQVGTPTYARDLAKAILEIIDKNYEKLNNFKAEIFHFSNEGICSWYDFAKAIFDIKSIDIKINPIETKDYPTPAKRPYYSVLNKNKIKKEFNIEIPYWRESLKKMLSFEV